MGALRRGLAAALCLLAQGLATAQALRAVPASTGCGWTPAAREAFPPAARHRIADSEPAAGAGNVRWAWLGSPTDRYAHAALGSSTHGSSLHAIVATPGGDRELVLRLGADRVFEDRQLRIVDLDRDGRQEIVVVEAQATRGAALVVFHVEGPVAQPRLAERARSGHVGSMRWLNPVGAADFDGDGKIELVSVSTPHIGGILTLYRYDPPRLVPLGREGNVSNHRMGSVQQRLAAILAAPGAAPSVLLPDQSGRALRLLGWDGGAWRALAPDLPLPARAERIDARGDSACVKLEDGRWLQVTR